MTLTRPAIAVLFLIALAAAQKSSQTPAQRPAAQAKLPAEAPIESPRPAPRKAGGTPAIVQQWMRSLTLRDRVAQLISVACYGEAPATRSRDFQRFRHWVRDLHVGGLIVNNRIVQGQVRNAEPYAMAVFINRMQKFAKVPLIVQGDFERGPSMRVANTTKFPHNMAYGAAGDLEASRYEGAETARQARALGFHWIFAPVADVNNNPDNPIINTRSYGEDPKMVAAHVAAYIEGAHSDPKNFVLVTAKHFPGHGDTNVDSHIGLPAIGVPRERMNEVELVPFKAAIEHGVDSIMTAHLAVPALEPEEIPATVSPKILTGLLREELGFKGIIVTDAMDMQGLSKQFGPGESAVRALEAGADMLIMPPKPEEAIDAIVAAVKSGRLTRKRIDQSLVRILTAKARVGLPRGRLVDVENISDAIENPEAEERAESVANRAVTLVRNAGDQVPLKYPNESCLIVLNESRYTQQGRQLITDMRARARGIKVRVLDPASPQIELGDTLTSVSTCKVVVIATFVTAGAYRGDVALAGDFTNLVNAIIATRVPVTLLAFGNPYLLRSFPNTGAYVAAFSTTTTSESAVARALFGEIPITGRMPVSIPGLASIGDGIQVPVRLSNTGGNTQ
jgi:beta-N-acetylhexosaminidase